MPTGKLVLNCSNLSVTSERLTIVCYGELTISKPVLVTPGSVIDLSKAQQATITSGAKLSLGKGAMLVLQDTPVSSTGSATIEGDEAVLQAPPVHVFDANIEVTGSWAIDRAYPQWFLSAPLYNNPDDIPGAGSCPDWAPAINKAVKMKSAGIIQLPKGIYTLKSTVWIYYGIRLHGATAANNEQFKFNENDSTNNFRVDGTMLAVPNGFDKKGFANAPISSGWNVEKGTLISNPGKEPYMVMVNYKQKAPDTTGNITIEGTKTEQLFDYPGQPAEVKNIKLYVKRTEKAVGVNEINGFFIHGAVNFRHVTSELLATLVYVDSYYSDRQSFFDCHTIREWQEPYIIDSKKDIKRFSFFLLGNGDALTIDSCGTSTNDYIGALYLQKCNGGSVINNIFNAQVVLSNCLNVNYSCNHMEYGAQLAISCSNVNASANFFEKGEVASVKIFGHDLYGDKSVVNLSNCQFHFFDGGHGKPETDGGFKPDVFKTRVTNMCQYDVEFSASACLTLCQNYRNIFLYGGDNKMTKTYTYGILTKLREETYITVNNVTSLDSVSTSPFDIFNLRSGFLSPWCQIAQGAIIDRGIMTPIFAGSTGTPYLNYANTTNQLPWLGPDLGLENRILEYKYCFLPEGEKYNKNKHTLASFQPLSMLTKFPSASNGGLSFIASSSSTAQRANLYIRRKVASSSSDVWHVHNHEVYIPMCFTRQLYDNFITLSSFKWSIITVEIQNTNI